MKKILLFLLAALVCMPCAHALRGAGYPAYDGASVPQNAICGMIDGQSLILDFDPSSDFSFLQDGYLQACFFAFDQTRNTYLEMYLMLPSTITAGVTLTPESEIEGNMSCVSLFEITGSGEQMTEYFVGQEARTPYPANASYTIYIEDVQAAEGGASVRGRLDAVLGNFVNAAPTGDTITVSGLQFHFVLPFENGKDVVIDSGKAPAFTLPPDYAVI